MTFKGLDAKAVEASERNAVAAHKAEPPPAAKPGLAEASWWHDDGVNGWVLCPDAPLLRDRFPHQYSATRPGASAAKPGPPSRAMLAAIEVHEYLDHGGGAFALCQHPECLSLCAAIRALEARAEKAEAALVELKAWAVWATKRLKADIKRRAALRVKP